MLGDKLKATRDEQKRIRGEIRRRFGFFISEFSVSGAFGPLDFDDLVRSGQIRITGEDPVGANSGVSRPNQSQPRSASAPVPKVDAGRKNREDSDEAYVIDLCDQVLGQRAIRQHRFPFLMGDGGRPLPVDAYYPGLNLVVEYRERQHTESVQFFDRRMTASGVYRGEQRRLYDQRRRDVLPRHGITVLEVNYFDLAHGRGKRLTRIARRMQVPRIKTGIIQVKPGIEAVTPGDAIAMRTGRGVLIGESSAGSSSEVRTRPC